MQDERSAKPRSRYHHQAMRSSAARRLDPNCEQKLASGHFGICRELLIRLSAAQPANDTGEFGISKYDFASESCFWTSKDQSRFGGGLNFYAYAANDPINLVDITGFDPSDATVVFGAGGGISLAGVARAAASGLAAGGPLGAAAAVIGALTLGAKAYIDRLPPQALPPFPIPAPVPGSRPYDTSAPPACGPKPLPQPYRTNPKPWFEGIQQCAGTGVALRGVCCLRVCGPYKTGDDNSQCIADCELLP